MCKQKRVLAFTAVATQRNDDVINGDVSAVVVIDQ